MAIAEEEVSTGSSQRKLLLIAGALGAVLLLVVLFFVFGRGGGDDAVDSSAPAVTAESAVEVTPETEKEAPAKTGDPAKAPVETFEVFAPRDPFKPLVSTGSESTSSGDTTSGSTDSGNTSGSTTSSGSTSSGSDDSDGGTVVNSHAVRLVEVFTDAGAPMAKVQVDATVYEVGEGDVFADTFQLVTVAGDCATMLFGDDQFTICEGETILK